MLCSLLIISNITRNIQMNVGKPFTEKKNWYKNITLSLLYVKLDISDDIVLSLIFPSFTPMLGDFPRINGTYTLLSMIFSLLLFGTTISLEPLVSAKLPCFLSRITLLFLHFRPPQAFRSFTIGQHIRDRRVWEFVEAPSSGFISLVICRLRSLE